MAKAKLWGGRFKKRIDPLFEKFSASFECDRRLLPYDLKIDAAHVKALGKCGVLKPAEAKKLGSVIAKMQALYEKGQLKLNADSEDVHSAVQTKLGELAGPLADKIHTARSRNDLVSQSSRLYCKDQAERTDKAIRKLQAEIVSKAERYQEVLLPGMTHLKPAQALSLSHIFLSYCHMLERCRSRFVCAGSKADVCVLGSGALAGTTFALDQALIAKELGLRSVAQNSYDVAGDRDFVLDLLFALARLGGTLSRIAEDLLIGQTKNFSYYDLDESLCTGSSMMPQKKNADFLELVRGVSGILTGNLVAAMTLVKGLPTSYNRDLQWDKKSLFDSAELIEQILPIFAKLFKTLEVNEKIMGHGLSDETLYATDMADYLVTKGVSFKTAHEHAGMIVRLAESANIPLSKIGLDLLKKIEPAIEGDFYDLFNARHSVSLKKTQGSTSPVRIAREIAYWKKILGEKD